MMNEILKIDDYLSKTECQEILELYHKTEYGKGPQTGNWAYRVKWPIYPHHIHEKINTQRIKLAEEFFHEKFEIDNLNITLWNPGNSMEPHSDIGGAKEYPWREYASIIYLNDDFDGGELYIPELNFVNKPITGQLVTFPGIRYLHGVTKVERGARYTSICWLRRR